MSSAECASIHDAEARRWGINAQSIGQMLWGAFSRFLLAVDCADLGIALHRFADDRRWGRARQELADLGLRPA